MNSILTLTFFCLLSVGQIFCFTPTAGASSLVGSITGGATNSNPAPTQWIEFMDMDNYWSQLGNTYTVEAWIHPGSSSANWQPVLLRHPGSGAASQEAHFIIGIQNTTEFVITAGCGCDSQGKNCGNGFYLSSKFSSGWNHVAVTFNGDNSSVSEANFYLNGVKVANSSWGANDSQCLGRSAQWSEYAPVQVGYLDDASSGPLGWTGQIDEIRFWFGIQNQTAIQNYQSVGLLGTEDNLFAYYPFSPLLSVVNNASASQEITNLVGDYLYGLPQPNPTNSGIWSQATNLLINSYSIVEGQDSKPDIPILPNNITFQSWPYYNTTTYTITSYSTNLTALLNNNQTFAELVISSSGQVTLYVDCAGNNCENYTNNWLLYYVQYTADVNGVKTAAATQYLQIVTSCPSGNYDGCGVCDGDNTMCTCVVYHGFDSERMSYVLLEWTIENLMGELTSTMSVLNTTINTLPKAFGSTSNPELRQEIYNLMTFYDSELTPYCGDVQDFMNQLMAVTPRPTLMTIQNSASPSSDGVLPYVPSFNIIGF